MQSTDSFRCPKLCCSTLFAVVSAVCGFRLHPPETRPVWRQLTEKKNSALHSDATASPHQNLIRSKRNVLLVALRVRSAACLLGTVLRSLGASEAVGDTKRKASVITL